MRGLLTYSPDYPKLPRLQMTEIALEEPDMDTLGLTCFRSAVYPGIKSQVCSFVVQRWSGRFSRF